jgi:hypothetical protein
MFVGQSVDVRPACKVHHCVISANDFEQRAALFQLK